MALNKEIERKWLIDKSKIPFDLNECKSVNMKQSYISFSPTVRLRSENDERFVLCVKTKPLPGSVARDEFECDISNQEYNNLLKKIDGTVIEKTRYYKTDKNGYTMEIDVFGGELDGLCYMEVEFKTEVEAVLYPDPPWAIKDVSSDPKYKNAYLAKNGKAIFDL